MKNLKEKLAKASKQLSKKGSNGSASYIPTIKEFEEFTEHEWDDSKTIDDEGLERSVIWGSFQK